MKENRCLFVLTIIVMGYLIVFSFFDYFQKDKSFSESENRLLTQKPKLQVETIKNKKYMNKADQYLSDQFLLRDKWIQFKTNSLVWSGQKEFKDIVILNKDTLIKKYYNWDFKNFMLDKKADYFTQEVKTMRGMVDGNIIIMMIPGANEIYADKVGKSGYEFYGDNYVNMLKQNLMKENIIFIPVKDTLISNREKQIFYRTDHHWTTEGAFYGYQAFTNEIFHKKRDASDYAITQISDSFLGTLHSQLNIKIKPDVIQIWREKEAITYTVEFPYENNIVENTFYNNTYLDTKDKYSVFLSGNHPLVIIQNKDTNKERSLLLIKDSYANCMLPFLLADYKTIYVVDKRYNKSDLSVYAKETGVNDVLYLYQTMQYLESF